MPFNPFSTMRPVGVRALPPEPPVGSVLGWTVQGLPLAAIRHEDGWYVTGEEDSTSWQDLVDRLTSERDPLWLSVGLATGWEQLADRHPYPHDDEDDD